MHWEAGEAHLSPRADAYLELLDKEDMTYPEATHAGGKDILLRNEGPHTPFKEVSGILPTYPGGRPISDLVGLQP